jgi:predicted MFS family arabinose efflux permease
MARTTAVGAPLRHPAFRRLWLGLSISYLGDQFTTIALLWFVLQLTGFGVGAFAGVLPLTRLSHRWRPAIALPMIAVLWGALLCLLFFIRELPLAMLFLGVAGASWAPYTPMETTLLQRLVPAEVRGQVFGARHSLVAAAAPLGAAFGGVLLEYLSAPQVIAISGLACILAGLGFLVSPYLRQSQRGSP